MNWKDLARKFLGSEQTPLNSAGTPSNLETKADKPQTGKWTTWIIFALLAGVVFIMMRSNSTAPVSASRDNSMAQRPDVHPGQPVPPDDLRRAMASLSLPSGVVPNPTEVERIRAQKEMEEWERRRQSGTGGLGSTFGTTGTTPANARPQGEMRHENLSPVVFVADDITTPASPITAMETLSKQVLELKQQIADMQSAQTARPQPDHAPAPEDIPTRLSWNPAKQEGLKDCTDVNGLDNETRYCLPEGTLIRLRLSTRAIGEAVGPVNAEVKDSVYSHDRQHMLIPAGTVLLGRAAQSSSAWQDRLQITFHRMLLPDGRSMDLEEGLGLDQYGAIGVHDKVNRHIASKVFTVVGLGSLSALAATGTGGYYSANYGDEWRQSVSQQSASVGINQLNRQLGRPNGLEIVEGKMFDLRLSHDIYLREWENR